MPYNHHGLLNNPWKVMPPSVAWMEAGVFFVLFGVSGLEASQDILYISLK